MSTSIDLAGTRILAWVHKYPPRHNAGAEWMLHELLRSSVAHGAHCSVVARHGADPGELDGVRILGDLRHQQTAARGAFDAAHVVITHLDVTGEAMRMARRRGKSSRLVHLLHNHRQLSFHQVRPTDGHLVANSEWLARTVPGRYRPATVIQPPVDLVRYRPVAGPHDRVVLVNMTVEKGAQVFWRLARELPHVPFLGVRGAYGLQLDRDPSTGQVPSNVEIIDQTADIVGDVYRHARVVVMPSSYESWGRVAVEASAGGIPVVYAPTDGLVEAMGGTAGMGIELHDRAGWIEWVRYLVEDDDVHAGWSLAGMIRARQLDPTRPGGTFDRWNVLLTELAAEDRNQFLPGSSQR